MPPFIWLWISHISWGRLWFPMQRDPADPFLCWYMSQYLGFEWSIRMCILTPNSGCHFQIKHYQQKCCITQSVQKSGGESYSQFSPTKNFSTRPLICFLLLEFTFSEVFYKRNHTICTCVYLASSNYNYLKIHACCCLCIYSYMRFTAQWYPIDLLMNIWVFPVFSRYK